MIGKTKKIKPKANKKKQAVFELAFCLYLHNRHFILQISQLKCLLR